eukprot:1181561-Prorocentrum_minimum.AAC.3
MPDRRVGPNTDIWRLLGIGGRKSNSRVIKWLNKVVMVKRLLRCTGPPVPITTRVHSTPQIRSSWSILQCPCRALAAKAHAALCGPIKRR